jgi:NIMA (never in mitosis gene a)-related kinase
MKHIHDRKIMHRDLKPLNIFLTKQGDVKIGDLGIAKKLEATLQMANTQAGTPCYMSPEIILGKEY